MNLKSVLRILIAAMAAVSSGSSAADTVKKQPKVLIAFYSYTGNTRAAAKQIQAKIGGDLFEIKPVKAYPAKYNACVAQAKKEIRAGFVPALSSGIDLARYDVIFIGSPNWWGTMAPPVLAFVKKNNFLNKTIVPFFTHGGGGMQQCESDMRKHCESAKAAKVLKALTCSGASTHAPMPELVKWAEDSLKTARTKK